MRQQRHYLFFIFLLSIFSLLFVGQTSSAEEPSAEANKLEKDLANPAAEITTLPLQFNFNFNSAHDDVSQTVFNIQPVFSGKVGSTTVINRFILPILDNPDATGTSNVSGFGDLTYQGFFAPESSGSVFWGAGVLFQAPTGSAALSSRKWAAGPAIVFVHETEEISLGALITQAWSFAGSSTTKDVSLLNIQPIASYRLGGGWSLNPFNNIYYDSTLSGEKWTVPLGLAVSKLLIRRAVPLNLTFGVFGNIVHPDNGPDWSMKAQMNFVF